MTEQSPNDAFHATSFLQGHNAEYIERLYAHHVSNLGAVNAGLGGAVMQAIG